LPARGDDRQARRALSGPPPTAGTAAYARLSGSRLVKRFGPGRLISKPTVEKGKEREKATAEPLIRLRRGAAMMTTRAAGTRSGLRRGREPRLCRASQAPLPISSRPLLHDALADTQALGRFPSALSILKNSLHNQGATVKRGLGILMRVVHAELQGKNSGCGKRRFLPKTPRERPLQQIRLGVVIKEVVHT